VTLVFMNGLEFHLLAQSCVSYTGGKKVNDEIKRVSNYGGVLLVDHMIENQGPAYEAGVRKGWQLNLAATFERSANKSVLQDFSQEGLLSHADHLLRLLNLTDVELVFEPAEGSTSGVEYFSGHGNQFPGAVRKHVPAHMAEFVFQSDGDKGTVTDGIRWGVLCVAVQSGSSSDEAVQSFVKRWQEERSIAMGSRASINVEPDDWDEPRLRALCARHGWEFEWMTEEGERRRRIEGTERARKVAAKTKASGKKSSQDTAWWRMNSVATALTASFNSTPGEEQPKQQQKNVPKIRQQDPS